jgi:hypothetical protein
MKKEKKRLANLASQLRSSEEQIAEIGKPDIGSVNANPPHGEKSGFKKLTITLPPALYNLLVRESGRRKMAGEPNHLFSAIIRESLLRHLAGSKESGSAA